MRAHVYDGLDERIRLEKISFRYVGEGINIVGEEQCFKFNVSSGGCERRFCSGDNSVHL